MKEWLEFFRAESGPKEGPVCHHKFDKHQRCVYCRRDVEDIWNDVPPKKPSADERIAEFFERVQQQSEEARRLKELSAWRRVQVIVVAIILGLLTALASAFNL